MLKMAFQVVELIFDADDNVVDRRAVPYPYPTRKDAVGTIASIVRRFSKPKAISGGQLLETV
jgi:predicted NBD/HSP70 family sugar kinase